VIKPEPLRNQTKLTSLFKALDSRIPKDHGKIHQKKVLTMLRLSSPNMSSFEIDQSREQSEGSHHSIVINNRVGQALKSVKNVQKAASSSMCEGEPARGGDHFEDLGCILYNGTE
jgi:hypothetical protein